MTAHTPETIAALLAGISKAPWSMEYENDDGAAWFEIYSEDGFALFGVQEHNGQSDSPIKQAANARIAAAAPTLAAELSAALVREKALREALRDMLSGWRYICATHGDLYGVAWDRAEDAAVAALAQEDQP